MEEKQIKLLRSLAKKIKAEDKNDTVVFASLQSAKILTKNGNFPEHFKHLKTVFTKTK